MRNDESVLREFIRKSNNETLNEADGWLGILGDIGMKLIASDTGRKFGAKALRGMASIVLIPSKMDPKELEQKSPTLASLVNVANSVGGFEKLAAALEGSAKALESMTDEDAKSISDMTQKMRASA